MRTRQVFLRALVSAILLSFLQCGDDSTSPFDGILYVYVMDYQIGPVADQMITISPEGVTAQTNKDGVAVFLLSAGDHFVYAHVCCYGPGLIEYHVPVTLQAGDATNLTLRACLTCE